MRLKEVFENLYKSAIFELYEENGKRIGTFTQEDKGVTEYNENRVILIEPNDDKSITITVEED